MSNGGWTYENLKEHYAESDERLKQDIVDRGKRFLDDQARVRAAKGFVEGLQEFADHGLIPQSAVEELRIKKPRKPRAHPERDPGQPKWNKTEARYAQHLDLQKRAGKVLWWVFEGMTLKLAPDTRYTPDFTVLARTMVDGLWAVQFHEVKALDKKTGKPRYEDDARVKIACAAEKFRPIRFVMVWPTQNGEWGCKEF